MSRPGPLDGLHVLVVEDNDDAREVTRVVLAAYGARVSVASGAVRALELLEERDRVDCIVSDISMPRHDGMWLIAQLRARDGDRPIPAVAVTARVTREDRRAILAAGFQVHLPKPVDLDQLVHAIRHCVERSRKPAGS
jgi:CheY-like chemotaxis protein